MLTPRRVPSGRFTFFTSTTSVVSKLPLVTLASARARPSGTMPPMAGPESLASVVVPPACATPEPVVTSTLAMARPMRTLDHVAFMTSRFLPHASVLRPDQPRGSAAPHLQSPSRSRCLLRQAVRSQHGRSGQHPDGELLGRELAAAVVDPDGQGEGSRRRVGSARAPLAATVVATADRTTVRTTMATRLLPLSLPSFGRTPRSGCHQRKRPPRQPSYGPPGTAGPASATTSNATSSHPTGAGATAPWPTPTAQRGTTGGAPRFPRPGVASVSCSPTEQGDNPPPAQCSAWG